MRQPQAAIAILAALCLAACGAGSSAPPLTPKLGDTFTETARGLDLELVWIPGGKFMMGSPDGEKGRDANEGPRHEVTLDGFWIGKFPVTQGQWSKVIGDNPSKFRGSPRLPVEQVCWDDAREFTVKLAKLADKKYSLPTEAQWEYACRAGTTTRYSFGDSEADLPAHAWLLANSNEMTHEVGRMKPNPWGLHDMHGNVWEWCIDWIGPYTGQPAKNPIGPREGPYRVLRGGCRFDSPDQCRSASRHALSRIFADDYLGLRVVLNP